MKQEHLDRILEAVEERVNRTVEAALEPLRLELAAERDERTKLAEALDGRIKEMAELGDQAVRQKLLDVYSDMDSLRSQTARRTSAEEQEETVEKSAGETDPVRRAIRTAARGRAVRLT
jgi:hypothetical protein